MGNICGTSPAQEQLNIRRLNSTASDDKRVFSKPSQECGLKELKQNYAFVKKSLQKVGNGAFGSVYVTHSLHDNLKVAIKVMDMKNKDSVAIDQMREEIRILQELDHPNIVKYYRSFFGKSEVYIVMELIEGSTINKVGEMQENQARQYIKKILNALCHMHALNIPHRDIKPANIMLTFKDEIKLIDFGLAYRMKEMANLDHICGSLFYMAPEVFNESYDTKCDLWSVGCLLYQMVCDKQAFHSQDAEITSQQLQEKIKICDYDRDNKKFQECSDQFKDFIRSLLIVDPKERPTAQDALKHPWLQIGDAKITLDPVVIERLKEFEGKSKLRMVALQMFIKMGNHKDGDLGLKNLEEQFYKIDTDRSGTIDIEEIKSAIQSSGQNLEDEEINDILKQCCIHQNQKISYTEFLSATIDKKFYSDETKIKSIFNQLDFDKCGFINKEDLTTLFAQIGKPVTSEELDSMIQVHDTNNDKKISYDEFKILFN